MLKRTVFSAVQTIRTALQDLLVPGVQTKRTYSAHVPGTAPAPSDATTAVSVYISRYREREVDNDRVLSTDYRAIILPIDPDSAVTADVNDLLEVPSLGKTFRILNCQRVMAGDTAVVATAQIRL